MNNVLLIYGLIFFIFGLLLMIYPPKEINSVFGYKTANSMKNLKSWKKGQYLGGKGMLILGSVELIFGLSSFYISFVEIYSSYFGFTIMFIGLLLIYLYTEQKLEEVN